MRLIITLTVLAFSFGLSFGQAGYDIEELFLDPHYFSTVDDAMAAENPLDVWYLDLSMQDPKLTKIPEEIYRFTNVKLLDVSFNRVASIDDGIVALKNLEVFNCSGNHYLKKFTGKLGELPKLKHLNIKTHGLTTKQVEAIGKSLPENCEFISQ